MNEIVTTGNCPWWLTDSGAVCVSKCVMALRGIAAPFGADTADGFAEPELPDELLDELGLGVAFDEPEAVDEVTNEFAEVVSADDASAERT